MARTVSDQLWATLRSLGAEYVFGLPGSQTIEAFQALKHSGLRTVVPTQEMAAAFMANGYARVSGRPGILTTIPGPGFTFALTGLAEAWLDSVPLLHIVPAAREIPGREHALQAIDQRAMAGAVVKEIVRAERVEDVASATERAYGLTVAGEPGPVMLELPEALFAAQGAPESPTGHRMTAQAQPASPTVLDEVARLIREAPRVLLYVGGGAVDAAEAVRSLARAVGAAVATTTSGRGVVPENDPRLVVRDPGVQDHAVLNALAANADLIVAIGCKFSHNGASGFHLALPSNKLITINTAGPSRNYPARIHMQVDAAEAIAGLLARIDARHTAASGWDAAELSDLRGAALRFEKDARVEPRHVESGMPSSEFVRGLRAALPDDAIVVTDSGFHQMSVRRHYEVRSPRGLIVPTNFQSMAYALPAAIGAALAAPGRRVVAVVGDGGMLMSGLELVTAVRESLALTVVVFNDGVYGLIRNAQLGAHGESHGTELLGTDFEALAAATGAEYRQVGADGIAAALSGNSRTSTVLLEVPLKDSRGLKQIGRRGKLRAVANRVMPSNLRARLRRLVRR